MNLLSFDYMPTTLLLIVNTIETLKKMFMLYWD